VSTPQVRAALETLRDRIEAGSASAAKHAPATARLIDGLRCAVDGPQGASLMTDMASAMGGGASAPAPGWLLRASLASCTATSIAMRAASLGVELATLEVTVESAGDLRGLLGLDGVSAGYASIAARVRIAATGTSAAELREIVEWADRHSPIPCTARGSPRYALDVEILPAVSS
jgi:uncharacterized OsmC-like protein